MTCQKGGNRDRQGKQVSLDGTEQWMTKSRMLIMMQRKTALKENNVIKVKRMTSLP